MNRWRQFLHAQTFFLRFPLDTCPLSHEDTQDDDDMIGLIVIVFVVVVVVVVPLSIEDNLDTLGNK